MKTILVIEDVAPLRQEILETLLCLNYQAIEAENGEIGVNLAQTYQPDLILCDIMMPGIDGYEVYRCLQDDPNTATIPFIFLSAKADRGDVRRGMNLGADDYLTKPFTSEELSDAISARIHKQDNQTQFYEMGLKQATSSLTSLAYSDPLTGLPNRIQLYQWLQDAIKQLDDFGPSITPPPLIAILWLRIDDFAALVESHGDVTGDWLLKEVSQRLTSNMTKRDLTARISRDEFCVVISGHSQKQTIVNIANQLHHQLIAPYQFGEQRLSIQVTGGISLYPDHNTNCDQLLQLAYRAMNYADQCGGNYCVVYDTDTDVLVQQRQWLEANLGTALAQSEFRLYYQPQINLITGRVVGAEALLRWQHPKLGLITPKQFIALAEVGGSIVPIGRWVLQTACAQVKAWRDSALFPVTIAVNLSATELLQERLVDHITDILQETGCSADMLCIEVTEVGVMKNVEVIAAVLRNLKAMGVRISLDDFGTGYSSLNYLHQLPIDFLKIDTSTIHNLPKDSSSIAIVTSMIALAQSQKLKVIAEGVETQEQLDFLRKHGCHMMQGNLYSPPIPNPEFEMVLASDRRLN